MLPYLASLSALVLATTLPFLDPHHYHPIATFRQEWLAGVLGLIALLAVALAHNDKAWTIPRTALLPLAMIVLAWIQFAAGKALFETTLLFSLYLAWAFIVMMVASRLAAGLGRERVAETLAFGLLTGALLVAGTGALQLWAPWVGLPFAFPSTIINGNIAQANSFADYLWIGVAAALFLHGRGRLHVALLWLTIPILLGFSLLSGSRAVYIFAVALSVWLALWAVSEHGSTRRRLLISALSLIPVLLILQFMISLQGTDVSSAQRLVAQGSYDPVRLTLWQVALEIFLEHPLIGAGLDSYSREFFLRIEHFSINGAGIPEHSHNLVTEFLAEFGMIGTVLLVGTGAAWLAGLRGRRGDAAAQLAIGVLLVLGLHSGLEYPLWYAHFLGIGALMLALGEGVNWQMPAISHYRAVLLATGLTGLFVLANLRSDYIRLEEASHGRTTSGVALSAEQQQEGLIAAYSHSLWRQYAALQFAARMPLESKDLDIRIKLLEEAIQFSPIRQAVFRHAALLQLNGQQAAAAQALHRAILSYPSEVPAALNLLKQAEKREPGLKPLIDVLTVAQRKREFSAASDRPAQPDPH